MRDDVEFKQFVQEFEGRVFPGSWENQFIGWCYRDVLQNLSQEEWKALNAPSRLAEFTMRRNRSKSSRTMRCTNASVTTCGRISMSNTLNLFPMQTNMNPSGGIQASDLLSTIYKVEVCNEQKISAADRTFYEWQQAAFYETLE